MGARLAPLPPELHATGAAAFARYAYPPNSRGLCGPPDTDELLGYASTGLVDPGLSERARAFEGAWPYLELIAEANGGADPLDPRVVRGYWLGTATAAAVGLRALTDHVETRFRRRSGRGFDGLTTALTAGVVPDHAFHVLAISPWAGMMRGEVVEPARTVLESCLIRPGRVITVGDGVAEVAVATLVPEGDRLRLGPTEVSTLRWARDGQAIVGGLAPGDTVATHWDWVCDRLEPHEVTALTRSVTRGVRLAHPGG